MQKLLLLSVVCLLSFPVLAQDVAKAWSGESELSFVKNTGNTVSDSLLAKQSLVYDVRPWRNTLKLEMSNVSSEVVDTTTGNKVSVRTGEKYYLTEQLDRFLSKKDYAFLRATYDKDRFSGFDNRSTAVFGYGRAFSDTEVFDLKAELGFGRSIDEFDDCDLSSPALNCGRTEASNLYYLSETLVWKFSKSAEFGQDLSVENTEDNRISRFHVYLKSQLISSIATKLGFAMKYTDKVPADKRRKDEELMASLVYSF